MAVTADGETEIETYKEDGEVVLEIASWDCCRLTLTREAAANLGISLLTAAGADNFLAIRKE